MIKDDNIIKLSAAAVILGCSLKNGDTLTREQIREWLLSEGVCVNVSSYYLNGDVEMVHYPRVLSKSFSGLPTSEVFKDYFKAQDEGLLKGLRIIADYRKPEESNTKKTDITKNRNILIVGICGVGKTWVMKSLIDEFNCLEMSQVKLVRYNTNKDKSVNVVGKYDGSMFEGSDKLSMSVSTSVDEYLEETKSSNFNVFEGDRFSNGKFIDKVKPLVIKILGDGSKGRESRGSSQSERQIKSITTRVGNISADLEFKDSTECLSFLKNYIS